MAEVKVKQNAEAAMSKDNKEGGDGKKKGYHFAKAQGRVAPNKLTGVRS